MHPAIAEALRSKAEPVSEADMNRRVSMASHSLLRNINLESVAAVIRRTEVDSDGGIALLFSTDSERNVDVLRRVCDEFPPSTRALLGNPRLDVLRGQVCMRWDLEAMANVGSAPEDATLPLA
jgi:hypothetical protein